MKESYACRVLMSVSMNPPFSVPTSNTLLAEIMPNFCAILPALDAASPFGKSSMLHLPLLLLRSVFLPWYCLSPSQLGLYVCHLGPSAAKWFVSLSYDACHRKQTHTSKASILNSCRLLLTYVAGISSSLHCASRERPSIVCL